VPRPKQALRVAPASVPAILELIDREAVYARLAGITAKINGLQIPTSCAPCTARRTTAWKSTRRSRDLHAPAGTPARSEHVRGCRCRPFRALRIYRFANAGDRRATSSARPTFVRGTDGASRLAPIDDAEQRRRLDGSSRSTSTTHGVDL
jgi:hypothetical protein